MLTKFQVKNFKKFNDNLVFDLSKKGDYDFNEEVIRNNNINFALIYGSNGSGKSNLGLAIFDILFHITDYSMPNHLYQDYLYGNGILENSAEFIYNLLLDSYNIEYRYIKRDKNNLIEEELKVNNETLEKCKDYAIYSNYSDYEIKKSIEAKYNLRINPPAFSELGRMNALQESTNAKLEASEEIMNAKNCKAMINKWKK